MILTLPLVLFIVMTELAIGSFTVLFLLDWRNQVKRNFLVLYGIIYILLAGLTYLFQQNFSTAQLLNTFPQLDKAWTGYEASPLLRGVFTVASFFAGALALGGVLTAMWLGHWYLVTPALSEKPLLFSTTLVLVGVLAQLIFTFTAGPSTTHLTTTTPPAVSATATITVAGATPTPHTGVKPANVPTATPLTADAIGWLRILVSFVIPLVLGGLAWKLIRQRSFQSATGMLYLVVVCTLAGEAIARGLFLMGLR